MTSQRKPPGTPVGGQFSETSHDEAETSLDEPLECIDGGDEENCAGPVEPRWPGYGDRLFDRCEYHGEERLKNEEERQRNYPDSPIPPAWFDPANAGEHWDDDY